MAYRQIGYNYDDIYKLIKKQIGGINQIPPKPPNPPNIDYGNNKRKFQRWEYNPNTNQWNLVKISGAGVIILEKYNNGQGRDEWAVVLFRGHRSTGTVYEELGGTCEQSHSTISDTVLEETKEESSNYIHFANSGVFDNKVDHKDVFIRSGEFRCYFVAVAKHRLYSAIYDQNVQKLQNRRNSFPSGHPRRPPHPYVETDKMKRFYLSDLINQGIMTSNNVQFRDAQGELHTLYGRTRGVIKKGLQQQIIDNVTKNGIRQVSQPQNDPHPYPHFLQGTQYVVIG